jgi:hypothetical protein
MNNKQIYLLIVLVVAVGIGGLVMHRWQGESWTGGTAGGEKLLAKLPVGDALAGVVIQKGTNLVTLVKKDDVWRVKERGGYPANFADLSSTILKLRDLKPQQTEQVGPSQLGRLELLPPGPGSNTATRVEFRDASGKALASLLLGKTQMREDPRNAQFGEMGGSAVGRWIMLGDAKDTASLVSDALASLAPNPGQWLNKDFFKVEKIKAISVTQSEATNSWSVSRTNETATDWILADAKPGESLDPAKAGGFSYALASPSFNDVVVDGKPEELGLDKPVTLVLQTFDGFTYTFKVGAKKDDAQALTFAVMADLPKERKVAADEKPEDKTRLDKEFADRQKTLSEKLATEKAFEKWTFLVSGWTLDAVLKNRGELLAEKKPAEPKPGQDFPPANPDEGPGSLPPK